MRKKLSKEFKSSFTLNCKMFESKAMLTFAHDSVVEVYELVISGAKFQKKIKTEKFYEYLGRAISGQRASYIFLYNLCIDLHNEKEEIKNLSITSEKVQKKLQLKQNKEVLIETKKELKTTNEKVLEIEQKESETIKESDIILKLNSLSSEYSFSLNGSKIQAIQNEKVFFSFDYTILDKLSFACENEQRFSAFVKFLENLQESPSATVCENIFAYLEKTKLQLTKNGNLVAYRRANKNAENDNSFDFNLSEFVSQQYFIKKQQKKGVSNYSVLKSLEKNSFLLVKKDFLFNQEKFELIGNLSEIFESLKNEEIKQKVFYTPQHDASKHKYFPNTLIEMSWKDADLSRNTCSQGFHASTFEYAVTSSYGNSLICLIVNPANLASIPLDNYPKFRCVQWYFACVITDIESWKSEIDKIDSFEDDFELTKIKISDEFKKSKNVVFKNANSEKENLLKLKKSKETEISEIKNKIKNLKQAKEAFSSNYARVFENQNINQVIENLSEKIRKIEKIEI